MSQPNHKPKNDAGDSRIERPDPEALSGGDDLLEYKYMLNQALKDIPEADPEEIGDDKIKDFKVSRANLRTIEQGIKNSRYRATRAKFQISEDAVSMNSNRAIEKLSTIISTILTYRAETDPQKRASCVHVLHINLDECRDALQKALAQFSQVKRLRGKSK